VYYIVNVRKIAKHLRVVASGRARLAIGTVVVSAASLVPAVAAETTLNVDNISDTLTAITGIFPGILNLIIAAWPILIIMALVGFVGGLLNKVLHGGKM
jgi:hypothetical protein